jgi:hypothetical protein
VADQDGDNGRDAIFQGLDLEPGTTMRRGGSFPGPAQFLQQANHVIPPLEWGECATADGDLRSRAKESLKEDMPGGWVSGLEKRP